MRYQGILLQLLALFLISQVNSQTTTISGFVYDPEGESIESATISTLPISKSYTITNSYGFFSLSLTGDIESIVIQNLGYITKSILIRGVERTNLLKIYLEPFSFKEVVVQVAAMPPNSNRNSLDIPKLKSLPFLMGEADPMKAFLRFPGVQGGLEGSASLHVRGGSPDQNLLLLDDAVVYNANHVFGFLSIFNSNVIKSADLYKGGFNAKYGGRLSSVIDVRLREGSRDTTRQKLGLGLIGSDYVREGPLFSKRGSYLFSLRAATILPLTLVQRGLYASGEATDLVTYSMFDGNLKLNYDINEKDKIYFSLYFSNDRMLGRYRGFSGSIDEDKNLLKWGNFSFSSRYAHPLSKKTFLNGIIYKSDYNFSLKFQTVEGGDDKAFSSNFIQQNKIVDFGAKIYFTTQINPFYSVNYGIEQANYRNIPTAQVSYIIENSVTDTLFRRNTSSRGSNLAAFFHNTLDIGKLTIEGGLRGSLFLSHFENINYTSLEPRISFSYKESKNLEFSLSYDKMFQSIQSLNSTGSGLPYETWVLAGQNIKPSTSNNFSSGINFNWLGKTAQSQISGYFRKFSGLNELIGRGFFILPPSFKFDEFVASGGNGEAWGLEFHHGFSWDKFKMEFNYTYSKSNRWFSRIDNGEGFPYKFDRRHVFLTSFDINLPRNWKMNLSWESQSGPPIDLPVSRSSNQFGDISYIYGKKNTYRLPSYHRMDISFYHSKVGKNNRLHEWNLGVYNVYNQKNPYFLRLNKKVILDENQQLIGLVPFVQQISLFRFLPYVKYTRSF